MEEYVTVSVPRLGITVEAFLMDQVICNSVQELGYDRPRPDQLEAVLQFVNAQDTFIPLPTGSGKSLCFASLPLMFEKLCEVTDTPNYHSICIVPDLPSLKPWHLCSTITTEGPDAGSSHQVYSKGTESSLCWWWAGGTCDL